MPLFPNRTVFRSNSLPLGHLAPNCLGLLKKSISAARPYTSRDVFSHTPPVNQRPQNDGCCKYSAGHISRDEKNGPPGGTMPGDPSRPVGEVGPKL
jgi:hypothetical protein